MTGWDAQTIATIAAIVFPAVLALAGLALLGRGYTFDNQALSPTDWQVLQAEQAYRTELGALQRDAETLVQLLNDSVPDPVRAQIVAGQIANRRDDPLRYAAGAGGQPALAYPRRLLIEAAVAVQNWAIGATAREPAQLTVDRLMASLQEAAARYDRD
jgi:hypothetical protein